MKNLSGKTIFWLNYHGGLLIFSLSVAMIMKYQQVGNALAPEVIVPIVTIFLMSACMGYLAIYMVKKYERYSHIQLTKKIIPALLIFYACSYLIANVTITLGVFGWFLFIGRDLNEFFPHLFTYELSFASKKLFIWLMLFTTAFFFILWQKSTKREQTLREEKLRFQYSNLKAQVNPHFLFNSLNTLSELIYEDAKKADTYIQRLSGMYRYVLKNEESELISMKKELEFVTNYFELQKFRNGDKIQLHLDIKNPGDYKVVPVSVQTLVENAVKHNISSKESPLQVRIWIEDNFLIVSNNLQRKTTMENTTQKGLQNLKERIRLILGKDLVIIEDMNEFMVKIPIILQYESSNY